MIEVGYFSVKLDSFYCFFVCGMVVDCFFNTILCIPPGFIQHIARLRTDRQYRNDHYVMSVFTTTVVTSSRSAFQHTCLTVSSIRLRLTKAAFLHEIPKHARFSSFLVLFFFIPEAIGIPHNNFIMPFHNQHNRSVHSNNKGTR